MPPHSKSFPIMKTKLLQFASLVAMAIVITASQASAVPELMSYQGRVTDTNGALIGNTSPVNRDVTFRLYTDATGGTAIYAEIQSVTISGGEFSVLIGNGTGISGSPGPSAPATTQFTLNEAINTSGDSPLYLGITVDDGNAGTVNTEIAPRQQLVSGAYAFRAGMAETVASGAVTAAMLGDSSVATGNIQSKAINSSKIADGGVSTLNIANSAITIAKLDTSSIGVWTPSGNNVWRNGNVGIGQQYPNIPLNFGNDLGNKIALYGNSGNHYGLGIQGSLLQIYSGAQSADVAFGYGHSDNFTETMRIKGTGNVGIGTSAPSAKLHVFGGNATIESTGSTGLTLRRGSSRADFGIAASNGAWSSSAVTGDAILRTQTGSLHLQTGFGSAGLTINSANNVSVPNSLSAGSLSVANNASVGNNLSVSNDLSVSGNVSALDLWARHMRANTLHVNSRSSSYSQGASLEWNKGDGDGGTWLLNQKGAGGGGIIFGEVTTNNVVTENMRLAGWGDLSLRGNYSRFSDARLKDNIEHAEPMLDRLMQVQFRRYNRIDRDDPSKEFGVIAQELQTIFPELVIDGMDDMLAVDYSTLASIASKALQELKVSTDAEIDHLNAEMAEKDIRITDLETRLAALEELIHSSR